MSQAYNATYCASDGTCYTDSGSSFIKLPVEDEACGDLAKKVNDGDESGELLIDLESQDGGTFTLSLPLNDFAEGYELLVLFNAQKVVNSSLGCQYLRITT